MKKDQARDRVAQPADEELKKHGDKLEKQVSDAAASDPEEKDEGKEKNAPKE